MSEHDPNRTTVIHAYARTVVDDSKRGADLAGSGTSSDVPVRVSRLSVDAAPLPDVGDVVGGLYRLTGLLGKGMFGKVYMAERVDVPEHQVALKLIPRSIYAGRNIERELVMLATVGHPNVVQLKDHGGTDDYVWLTMPVYLGETLWERLDRGPLSLVEAHGIFLSCARGLAALHEAGLRHQDVKPENIFLAQFGGLIHPILLDLGVAAEREAPFVAGTALYASPEQLASLHGYPGAYELSEKMDTYCLGATLLMALVGPRAYPGDEAKDRDGLAMAQEVRATTPLPNDALPELTGVARELLIGKLKRWLAFEPSDRPSMTTLADDLDVLLEQKRQQARDEEARRAKQKQSLQRVRLVLGAMLLIGLAGGALAYSKREALEMANALDQAKKKGAESFDKLDTCVAAHRLAAGEVSNCKTDRKHEQDEFRATLDNMTQNGSAAEKERARELHAYAVKVRVCEEGAVSSQKTASEELAKTNAACTKEKTSLGEERDKQHALADERLAAITAREGERDQCRAEEKSCVEERDACTNAHTPMKPPAIAGSGVPNAPPTAIPAATTVDPAPVPAPQPPPPAPAATPAANP